MFGFSEGVYWSRVHLRRPGSRLLVGLSFLHELAGRVW